MGDEILAAGQCQRHFDLTGQRSVVVGSNGKPRWSPIWDGNPAIVKPHGVIPDDVHVVVNGPHCRPYIIYPFTEETGWTFNKAFRARDFKARIYLTEMERARGDLARSRYGPYVLIEPYTKHVNLRWPIERWQALVEAMPDVTFVQHVHKDSPLLKGVHCEHATFRDACGLLTGATLYVRSESGMCHAAAALRCPNVAIWGGCMDWEVLGGYPLQQGLVVGDPCGRYLPCPHCAEVMASIPVEDVVTAIRKVVH